METYDTAHAANVRFTALVREAGCAYLLLQTLGRTRTIPLEDLDTYDRGDTVEFVLDVTTTVTIDPCALVLAYPGTWMQGLTTPATLDTATPHPRLRGSGAEKERT